MNTDTELGFTSRLGLAGILAVAFLAFGCVSPNVNPAAPGANTGYVDFYAATDGELAWEVQRFNSAASRFSKVFSELDPVVDGILRLAFAPGHHRLRITFLNRVIAEPALLEVNVQDGRITPVTITLTETGIAAVPTKDTNRGGTAYGRYGRRTKVGSYETPMYRVTAVPQEPRLYQLKERMPYGQNAPK